MYIILYGAVYVLVPDIKIQMVGDQLDFKVQNNRFQNVEIEDEKIDIDDPD
jgi:hypothetical protein